MEESLVIEGYASLFGVEDVAGAIERTLRRHGEVRILLRHVGWKLAGRWKAMREYGRGLFVRGLVTVGTPAGRAALKLVAENVMEGLSIGFIARDWSPRVSRGREHREIELREISLVTPPMLPEARFSAAGTFSHKRVAA